MELKRQIRKLEKALGFLKSNRSSAAPSGVSDQEWGTVSKSNAITILEEMVEDLKEDLDDQEKTCEVCEDEPKEPKRKPGRYMGIAGQYD